MNRIGLGKVRHIEVTQLWAQEKVSKGEILVTKVKTEENLADALTKHVSKEIMSTHIKGVGGEIRQDRHSIAPVSEYQKEVGEEWEGEDEDQ